MFIPLPDIADVSLAIAETYSESAAARWPLDEPTTLQLALAGFATLAVYWLVRRPKLYRGPSIDRPASTDLGRIETEAAPDSTSREAA